MFVTTNRWDSAILSTAHAELKDVEAGALVVRAKVWATRTYHVSAGITCMWSFLAEANDARYVVAMERYLFRDEGDMPLLPNGSLLIVALTSNRVKLLKVV